MRAELTTSFKGAYVVRISQLDNLRRFLESNVGAVVFKATCADEASRRFKTWHDLYSYENAENSQIVELSIQSNSHDRDKYVRINISSTNDTTISLSIDSPDDEFTKLKIGITEIINGMKHKHLSILFDFNFARYWIAFWGIISLVMVIYNLTLSNPGHRSVITVNDLITMAVYVIYILFFCIFVFYCASKLRPKILPTVYFAIGQGQQRYQDWQTRWKLTMSSLGVVLSIIIAIVLYVL